MKDLEKKRSANVAELFPISKDVSVSQNLNFLNSYLDMLRNGIYNLMIFTAEREQVCFSSFREKYFEKINSLFKKALKDIDVALGDMVSSTYKDAMSMASVNDETGEIKDKDTLDNESTTSE